MKTKTGFTLLELLISMGIMTILITILAQVFGSILMMRQKNEAVSALAQDSRFIVMKLAYDIARSTSISAPTVGNAGQTLVLVIGGVNYVYSVQDNNLTLAVGGGTPQIINSVGTSIGDLNFIRNNDFGSQSSIELDTTLFPTVIQAGTLNDKRRVVTSFVTR